jgi:hypothetical protein
VSTALSLAGAVCTDRPNFDVVLCSRRVQDPRVHGHVSAVCHTAQKELLHCCNCMQYKFEVKIEIDLGFSVEDLLNGLAAVTGECTACRTCHKVHWLQPMPTLWYSVMSE